MLDLNMTKSLLEAFFKTHQLSQELLQLLGDSETKPLEKSEGTQRREAAAAAGIELDSSTLNEKRLSWNPFVIRNLTHHTIKYWPSAASGQPSNPFSVPSDARTLAPGAEEPLTIKLTREELDSDNDNESVRTPDPWFDCLFPD